jgi:valyl-tRNA synthetase
MSKSLGNVVCPTDLIESYGKDYLRYYLCAEVPFGSDGNFSMDTFVYRTNADLANDFGNLVNRVLSMVHKNCGGIVPGPGTVLTADDRVLLHKSVVALLHCRMHVGNLNLKAYCEEVITVSRACNKYVDTEKPWLLCKTNLSRFMTVMFVLTNCIRRLAILLDPVIPDASKRVLDQLSVPTHLRTFSSMGSREVAGLRTQSPVPIFPKLMFTHIEEMTDNQQQSADQEGMDAESKASGLRVRQRSRHGLPAANAYHPVAAVDLPAGVEVIETEEQRDERLRKIAALEAQITHVGSHIRSLKAANTSKADLKPHIDSLLSLKESLKSLAQQKKHESADVEN